MGNYLLHDKIEAAKTFQMRQGDMMRQTQQAVQIAITRDQFQWGSGLYSFLVAVTLLATMKEKKFPKPLAVPLVLGGFVLTYLHDLGYGDKMIRIRKESEFILEHERHLLLPVKSMPARKFWEVEEAFLAREGEPLRVSDMWPFGLNERFTSRRG